MNEKNNIFPKEILDATVEVHRFNHQTKSKVVYSTLLIVLVIAVSCMPFLHLDVYSSSTGIIKSEKEKNQITSLHSGRISATYISENEYVKQGDTLLVIDNAIGEEKHNLLQNQLEQTNSFITDLNRLVEFKTIKQHQLQSVKYQKDYAQYFQKLHELQTRYKKAKTDFKRQETLYNKAVIARIEYEESQHNYNLATSELNYLKKQKRNQWQSELTNQLARTKELESQLAQYKEEQSNYYIKAPINGTIQDIKGLESGNFVIAGNVLATISPDTDLIAECYVSPSDIGLLKEDTPINFQIDAFNYNQWGMATGKIKAINKDISILNNNPMFKVVCTLSEDHLSLKNGFKGSLKKGMTFNARFFIAKRSVFDLLYDKVDDWFNPGKN